MHPFAALRNLTIYLLSLATFGVLGMTTSARLESSFVALSDERVFVVLSHSAQYYYCGRSSRGQKHLVGHIPGKHAAYSMAHGL